jgi:asparagine synthase (glutamine-hydrolysing)
MGEVLLQRVDRVTMLQSLEARSPFLDHELVELAFSIPGPWKITNGTSKALLKELAKRVLPQEILTRNKMGFSFPFKERLRGELGPLVERVFNQSRLIKEGWINGDFCKILLAEHRSGRFDHAPRLWMLFDLCRWYDRWIG